MQDNPVQTSDDYVEQFRRRHLPSQAIAEAPATKQQPSTSSVVGGFLQRAIRKFTTGHTECNY